MRGGTLVNLTGVLLFLLLNKGEINEKEMDGSIILPNKEEIPEEFSKSQIATLNEKSNRQGSNVKKMPFAFTEQGIYMLATVLRGELAEQQSIFIMCILK